MSAIVKALDTIEKLQRERDEAKSEISAWKAKHADVAMRMARNASERDEAREQNERYKKSIALTDANFRRLQEGRDALVVALREADDLIEDLMGYATQSWDWKYGDYWREEQDKIRAAIAKVVTS